MKVLDVEKNNSNHQSGKFVQYFCFDENDFENFSISPFAVLSIFQDIATKHAEALGVGFYQMLKRNLLWVTMRIKFEVVSKINANENYKIVTYPSGKSMIEFDRDYVILDKDNNIVLKGQSKWCLIDSKTRKIARMIDGISLTNVNPIFEDKFLKTDSFEPNYPSVFSYKISKSDIDKNGHTNNTVYAKIVTKLFKSEAKKLKFFQINFLKESLIGDNLDIYTQNNNDGFTVVGKLCGRDVSFTSKIVFE